MRDWASRYGVSTPPQGYWVRRRSGYSHEESLKSQAKIQKPAKRFTREQVIEIKKLTDEGILSLREIGERYNACHQSISDIKYGISYKSFLSAHVETKPSEP